jgi:CHAD domain-containing protein
MQVDRWLGPVPADETLQATAGRALEGRISALLHYLRLANGHSDDEEAVEDHEQIHRIRVWSRRSVAALRVFSPVLESGPAKQWRKLLASTRRATGRIRDLDVLVDRLLISDPGTTELVPEFERQRHVAREELRLGWRSDNPEWSLRGLLEELPGCLHPPAEIETFSTWAPARLSKVYGRFRRSWPLLGDDAKAHHRFRIRAKDLRYALELLAAPFASEIVAATYSEMEMLQDLLGEMNDLSTSAVILGELAFNGAQDLADKARRQLEVDSATAANLLKDFHGEESAGRRRNLEGSFATLLSERLD